MKRYECLTALQKRLSAAADAMIAEGYAGKSKFPATYEIPVHDVIKRHGVEKEYLPLFWDMLDERPELKNMVLLDERYRIAYLYLKEPGQAAVESEQSEAIGSERLESLLRGAMGWINEQVCNQDLYETFHIDLGMTDDEITELGYTELCEPFYGQEKTEGLMQME
jgi:hypothetical protein